MPVPTNDSQNTATPTADDFTTASTTFGDLDVEWGDVNENWSNPQQMSNDAINTSSITNDATSE